MDGPCLFIMDGPGASIRFVKDTPGESHTKYKAETVQGLNIQNFASRENKEPV